MSSRVSQGKSALGFTRNPLNSKAISFFQCVEYHQLFHIDIVSMVSKHELPVPFPNENASYILSFLVVRRKLGEQIRRRNLLSLPAARGVSENGEQRTEMLLEESRI